MYEIISGNIVEGTRYQVTGTGAIIYNAVTVNVSEFFEGIFGVTTYTVSSGTPVVIEASIFLGMSATEENDFYLGLFNNESRFLGMSLGVEDIPYDPGDAVVIVDTNSITFSIGLSKDAYMKSSIKKVVADSSDVYLILITLSNTVFYYDYRKIINPVTELPFISLEAFRLFIITNLNA